jgi:RNA polymerase sigma-70 factor (ECF subfamily)
VTVHAQVAEGLFRREGARLVASLTAHLGTHRLELAEDVVQEALVRALQTWPYRGIPDNPAAWLTRTAKNLAVDALRREKRWQEKEGEIGASAARWLSVAEEPGDGAGDTETVPDVTLRMLFVCFHPRLSAEAQVALALRTVCGLSPAEIAAAFLTSEAAIHKRLVRARQRIRDLQLPFAVPEASELPDRLDGVLGALYLLFNEGYKASGGDQLIREELCREAIRLTELLAADKATAQPRTFALLALMCLNASRLSARTDSAGAILRLHEQDRSLWDRGLIARGMRALARSSSGLAVSSYHLEAGIAAAHCLAPDEDRTDWGRILGLYDQLLALKPSPVVAMNRAVAVSRVSGAQAGWDALEAIRERGPLQANHLYHVIRGSFAAALGDLPGALADYRKAQARVQLTGEKDFIAKRIAELQA